MFRDEIEFKGKKIEVLYEMSINSEGTAIQVDFIDALGKDQTWIDENLHDLVESIEKEAIAGSLLELEKETDQVGNYEKVIEYREFNITVWNTEGIRSYHFGAMEFGSQRDCEIYIDDLMDGPDDFRKAKRLEEADQMCLMEKDEVICHGCGDCEGEEIKKGG